MGRGERRELVSHLRVLLLHLLKWAYQPARRSRGWQLSIEAQRLETREHLAENPSLKPQLDAAIQHAYRLAAIEAERQTRLSRETFPATCPWSFDQIMSDAFLPE